jgi:drug/metabolite transporter (DMT)-like permease
VASVGPQRIRIARGIRLGAGELSILVAAAAYGVSTTLSVAALNGVRPADLLAVELGGGAAVLVGAAAWTGRLRWRGAPRQLLLGCLVPGLAFLLGDLGLARTSASAGSLLLATDPLLSVLLAIVVLGERLHGRAIGALAVGFAGSALVAFEPDSGPGADMTVGNLLVVGAVFTGAVFLVATRRYSQDSDGLNAGAWQTTGGALSAIPFVAVTWSSGGSQLGAAGTAPLAACAGVLSCGVVAGVAFNRGIGLVPAARAGQLANLTPAVGMLMAVVLLGERPTVLKLAGGAAILVGLVLLLRSAPASEQRQPMADLADSEPAAVIESPAPGTRKMEVIMLANSASLREKNGTASPSMRAGSTCTP